MRNKVQNKLIGIVGVIGAMLMLSLCPGTVMANAGKAMFVLGTVEKTSRSGHTVKMGKGMEVDAGDTIVTFGNGQVMFKMLDGSKITVRPDSSVKISAYSFTGDAKTDKSHYELIKGGFRSLTGGMGKRDQSSFKFKTPVATMGIRGTDFAANYCETDCGDDAGLHVDVIDGGVSVTNDAGTIDVDPGQFARIQTANSPPAFVDELPASMSTSRPVSSGSKESAKGAALTHEEEMVAIAVLDAEDEGEKAQVVQELIDNGMPTHTIIKGATSVGVEATEVIEPLLNIAPDKESVIEELLEALPQTAGDIMSMGIATGQVSAEKMRAIATRAGVSPEIQKSAVALGNLMAPPKEDKEQNAVNSATQPAGPGEAVPKSKPTPPAQLIPSGGTGGGEPASPS